MGEIQQIIAACRYIVFELLDLLIRLLYLAPEKDLLGIEQPGLYLQLALGRDAVSRSQQVAQLRRLGHCRQADQRGDRITKQNIQIAYL